MKVFIFYFYFYMPSLKFFPFSNIIALTNICFMEVAMDNTDMKIISILKNDSRVSYTKIAKLVNMSVPSVIERINKLNDSGIIKKYTIEISYKNLGKEISAIISIDVKRELYENFFEFCKKNDSIIHFYRVIGSYNAIIFVTLKNTNELENLIDTIKHYGKCNTSIITSSYYK